MSFRHTIRRESVIQGDPEVSHLRQAGKRWAGGTSNLAVQLSLHSTSSTAPASPGPPTDRTEREDDLARRCGESPPPSLPPSRPASRRGEEGLWKGRGEPEGTADYPRVLTPTPRTTIPRHAGDAFRPKRLSRPAPTWPVWFGCSTTELPPPVNLQFASSLHSSALGSPLYNHLRSPYLTVLPCFHIPVSPERQTLAGPC
ncbi:hypothetical protein EJ06DRAFT_194565 [Trichodelitschia bisporula]|uniref:Uncharacterized protein n=1 Tax=Trichodelitschia bisporula TaxID=703511 RepID=A0A6G1I8F2_9PEZI|nr:hypothetical protein EJ06DRAFT_194565 [Trichodelitschia bisporula]